VLRDLALVSGRDWTMVILYHYTNTEGKTAIERSGKINKSERSKHRDDAMYGTGVYLTSLGPDHSTAELLGNNYDGIRIPQHMKSKTEWYFEFDTSDPDDDIDDVEEIGNVRDRDIWILRGRDLPVTRPAKQRTV